MRNFYQSFGFSALLLAGWCLMIGKTPAAAVMALIAIACGVMALGTK